MKSIEENIEETTSLVPRLHHSLDRRSVPPNTSPELVMFCRRVYDFRAKRLIEDKKKKQKHTQTHTNESYRKSLCKFWVPLKKELKSKNHIHAKGHEFNLSRIKNTIISVQKKVLLLVLYKTQLSFSLKQNLISHTFLNNDGYLFPINTLITTISKNIYYGMLYIHQTLLPVTCCSFTINIILIITTYGLSMFRSLTPRVKIFLVFRLKFEEILQ